MNTHIQSLAQLLGITDTVNGTWIEAIARYQSTVSELNIVDVGTLFAAITADPFDVDSWKASFVIIEAVDLQFNGVASSDGDFSTEDSYSAINGIIDSPFKYGKETIVANHNYMPTGGDLLGSISESLNLSIGGIEYNTVTYKYEENAAATGTDEKYVHDFRIEIDSTTILGYVIIYADDSEFHNFIIDSAGN